MGTLSGKQSRVHLYQEGYASNPSEMASAGDTDAVYDMIMDSKEARVTEDRAVNNDAIAATKYAVQDGISTGTSGCNSMEDKAAHESEELKSIGGIGDLGATREGGSAATATGTGTGTTKAGTARYVTDLDSPLSPDKMSREGTRDMPDGNLMFAFPPLNPNGSPKSSKSPRQQRSRSSSIVSVGNGIASKLPLLNLGTASANLSAVGGNAGGTTDAGTVAPAHTPLSGGESGRKSRFAIPSPSVLLAGVPISLPSSLHSSFVSNPTARSGGANTQHTPNPNVHVNSMGQRVNMTPGRHIVEAETGDKTIKTVAEMLQASSDVSDNGGGPKVSAADAANKDHARNQSLRNTKLEINKIGKQGNTQGDGASRVNYIIAPKHILVVDDVASCRKMLIRILKNDGHTCEEAKDGQDCIDKYLAALAEGDPYDVILLDSEMPVMTGELSIYLPIYLSTYLLIHVHVNVSVWRHMQSCSIFSSRCMLVILSRPI
jgi:hypothetical protein